MSRRNYGSEHRSVPWLQVGLGIGIINLIILDLVILAVMTGKSGAVLGEQTDTVSPCPQSCVTQLKDIAAGYGSSSREQYVALGSGTGGGSTDWSDMTGIEATIDTAQYRRIKTVTFEPTVSSPNGTVWVRLYNVTDMHPVWFSEVVNAGGTPTALTSTPVQLTAGRKLYRVQMKTQLPYTATLQQARIHIVTY